MRGVSCRTVEDGAEAPMLASLAQSGWPQPIVEGYLREELDDLPVLRVGSRTQCVKAALMPALGIRPGLRGAAPHSAVTTRLAAERLGTGRLERVVRCQFNPSSLT